MVILANGILGFTYERRPQEVESSGMFGIFNIINIGAMLVFFGFFVAGFWHFSWWVPLLGCYASLQVRITVSPRLLDTWKVLPMILFICGLALLVVSMNRA